MLSIEPVAFWMIGFVGMALLGLAMVAQLAGDARLDRRRRKNHGRIVSRARRPLVKLSVTTARN